MKKLLIAIASIVTLGSASQVMAKPCNTTISFVSDTGGQDLTLVSVKTYPANAPLPKVHKRSGITLRNGETTKISMRLARKCNISRVIRVEATNSYGTRYCGNSNTQAKGVMDFGLVTLVPDCSARVR